MKPSAPTSTPNGLSQDIPILYVEDDTEMGEMLKQYLERFGYCVHLASDPAIALEILKKASPKLILLDIMLPGINGFELCKKIRAFSDIPIIFLSARGEVTDRVVGLDLGADDYLPKPFEPRELVSRIQSVLRRTIVKNIEPRVAGGKVFRCLDLTVDLGKRDAYFGHAPCGLHSQENSVSKNKFGRRDLDLTTIEFDLLVFFMRNPGQVLSRDYIQDQLKGTSWDVFDRSIDVTVSKLRQKLEDDPKKPRYLKTVWGSGYLFVGEVSHEK